MYKKKVRGNENMTRKANVEAPRRQGGIRREGSQISSRRLLKKQMKAEDHLTREFFKNRNWGRKEFDVFSILLNVSCSYVKEWYKSRLNVSESMVLQTVDELM